MIAVLALYVAVYVVFVGGAVIAWDCAPPSDQDAKVYVEPLTVCGDVAVAEFPDPTITVRVNGAIPE